MTPYLTDEMCYVPDCCESHISLSSLESQQDGVPASIQGDDMQMDDG